MSAGAVVLDKLKLGFNGVVAADITMAVEPGEVVVFLGPSGCGKSTILRALAGLLTPMSGTATVDGAPVTGNAAQCAMVFQEDALFPWRTALKNVQYPLRLRGVRGRDSSARPPSGSSRSAWAHTSTTCPASCRAECASACSWPARWPANRG
ncbi:ATP-binding cassette domain-containing protein [Mycobacterium sp. CPCC 205372]|uniref:ATP-binding cassette domain-containing protein n=1 Tax=Mycobacterium hippophais TaxID=3016340 RepID=A0ABT4Q0J6_9MYCO|nr:ATP-binding cassette domain-containing protein [Mycobacterium hippophais]MCZ8382224.1 ATP-binding cassette domain-containing protein [Mycobacterium hippophais]